ncbi:hypothetical protein [Paenibacillus sp. FSL L8-0709]|uniref:hypothetical protein n=1 Tax=Paenibacillus sp. FSL L8-0709 TaxID=2975312 RepID=UPI0030F55788
MDIGVVLSEWFLSMNLGQKILFVIGLIITLGLTYFVKKGIEWIFYPYKKSYVGKKYFWLR